MASASIVIDGKRYAWRDILKLRREQRKAARQTQLTLFELKDDRRPASQRRGILKVQTKKIVPGDGTFTLPGRGLPARIIRLGNGVEGEPAHRKRGGTEMVPALRFFP